MSVFIHTIYLLLLLLISLIEADLPIHKCFNYYNVAKSEPDKILSSLLQSWRYSHRMIQLAPSTFQMGSPTSVAIPGDGETPLRLVKISTPFWIDTHEVTVAEFTRFALTTNFISTAEVYKNSFVFWQQVSSEEPPKTNNRIWWWIQTDGVSFRNTISDNHPVVHVSWDDAQAYCQWKGGRLPSEAEWEYACKAGCDECIHQWGPHLKVDGKHMANIWQGKFPRKNTQKDGHLFTAPVQSYPPNSFGLYDLIGNVWEWVDQVKHSTNDHIKIQKGGSFLCHRKHCYRYRCGARTSGSRDSTASNLGFRCVVPAI